MKKTTRKLVCTEKRICCFGIAACIISSISLMIYTIGGDNLFSLNKPGLMKNYQVSSQSQKLKISINPSRPGLNTTFLAESSTKNYSRTVTLVTAYFNLGSFQKGELKQIIYTPMLYKRWMAVFSRINNPMVAYFDDVKILQHFKLQRMKLISVNNKSTSVDMGHTKLCLIAKEDLWSFSLINKTREIFSQTGYPIHHPNTVIPEYSCAMHAKYELLYNTMVNNPYKTKYFSWLDIGLYRDIVKDKNGFPNFQIKLPPHFNDSKIAYGDVFRGFKHLSDEQIFKANLVWVSGAFFIGKIDTMLNWAVEYLKFVDYFVNIKHLMNTDQQVIFSIFSNYKPKSEIQTYFSDGESDEWFYLGYLCKNDESNATKLLQ